MDPISMHHCNDTTPLLSNRADEYLNFDTFCEKANYLTHFRVNRTFYCHHFIVLGLKHIDEVSKFLTVAHYTASLPISSYNDNATGKFVRETFRITNDETNTLLDFKKGVVLVTHKNYPRSPEAIGKASTRLLCRLDEEAYHISCNNCEHIVNYILTGSDFSSQVQNNRMIASLLSVVTAEIKDIGITKAIILSFLVSIVGANLRHAYVHIIVTTFISLIAHTANIHCSFNTMENNILENARMHLSEAVSIPYIEGISNVSLIVDNIHNEMNNTDVCKMAAKQVSAMWKYQLPILIVASLLIETLFLVLFYHCKLLPLLKFHVLKSASKSMIVRCVSGYLSSVIAIPIGMTAELFIFIENCNSTVWFLIITLVASIGLRLLFAALVGICIHCRQSSKNHDIANHSDDAYINTPSFSIDAESLRATNQNARGVLCCLRKHHNIQFAICMFFIVGLIAAVIVIAETKVS
ncbi:uncharacterized protein LOC134691715 [Mytilus trossulus]|uniref:uncharacterized protein LOC134691715 n=1 Tax=Mytilus trossulus TaxID=6551 RepID=UPI0030048987